MTLPEAIESACSAVGIKPPKTYRLGQWAQTDVDGARNGKGDGRLIVDDQKATAWNWQTGDKHTVWLKDNPSPTEKRQAVQQMRDEREKQQARRARAAKVAEHIVSAATLSTHPYLARKGFPNEQSLVVDSVTLQRHVGDYLVAGDRAVVIPCRRGSILSVQLIWEDGTKKFLKDGEVSGTYHRISNGTEHWLAEGLATGLSLRLALKGLNRSATILCCFSASNVAQVARSIQGKCFIAADNDKPLEQFGGLGTGEHWAKMTGKPYTMPPEVGTDFNDMHQQSDIFAVQRHLIQWLRRK